MIIDKGKTASIRKAFGTALAKAGETNQNVVVLDADLACSTQTKIFQDKFPERFFDVVLLRKRQKATGRNNLARLNKAGAVMQRRVVPENRDEQGG